MAKNKDKNQQILKPGEMNPVELRQKAAALKAKIARNRLDREAGRLKNIREGYNLRKELARIKTAISIKSKLNSVKS